MPYKLAPGWNNPGGLIDLRTIVSGLPLDSHASSLGTFRAAREFENLAGVTEDDGDDVWEWEFASLLPSDIATLETIILDGARSGYCTAETRDRWGNWTIRSAIMTLPAILPRVGVKFGDVVIRFTKGTPTT